MKHFLCTLLLALVVAAGAQAQQPTRLTLPLREVTLFPSSAQLHHQGELALPAGPAVVRLVGLSPQISGPSVQAEVAGGELESVDLVVNTAAQPGTVPGTLTDSLRVAQTTLTGLLNEQTANAAEKTFLEENKRVSTTGAGNWLAEVQRGAAYYRARIAALARRDAEIALLLPAQKQQVEGLSQRAGLLPNPSSRPQVVVLRLNLARAATVRIGVTYQLSGSYTGWQPEYELRVNETSATKLQVVSRARLTNASGLNWTNVPVSLRTATPASDVSRPSLDPWAVSFGRAGNEGEGRLDDFAVKGSGAAGTAGAASEAPDLGSRLTLRAPITLASSASQTFKLAEQTLPMRLEYLAVPKREEEVFLLGKVADWNQINFLAETAKVFFRGAYVGETTLDTRAYTDTLEVSLGRDPQVQLTRTKREDFESPISGGSRERTKLAYELNVKNTHSYPVRLRLLDQVPVTQEKEITVKVLEIGGALLEPASGKLTWVFTLAPGASRKLPFSFQVEAPADKNINLRRDRNIRSPKFR